MQKETATEQAARLSELAIATWRVEVDPDLRRTTASENLQAFLLEGHVVAVYTTLAEWCAVRVNALLGRKDDHEPMDISKVKIAFVSVALDGACKAATNLVGQMLYKTPESYTHVWNVALSHKLKRRQGETTLALLDFAAGLRDGTAHVTLVGG